MERPQSQQRPSPMLFHSQAFILAFLPVVAGLYFAAARRPALRQWLLIAASLAFYGWWDARFLPLLVGQTLASWALAELHFATRARWPLWLGVAGNLAALGTFKYLDFAIEIASDLIGAELPRSGVVLPIGISFYTFQIISYLMDCAKGTAPRYHVRRFALFVTLFPQLIAGPIVRHNEIIDQFDADPLRPGAAERIGRGLALFVVAAAFKVFVADALAVHVDAIFAAATQTVPTVSDATLGLVGFSLQIFFDFAAYSEMAIGLGLVFGFVLPRNFDQPYRSVDIQQFWRRWHMTLSRFLRDYVYIPLGGSREGPVRYVVAATVTMGLCGLWHGAGWNFVLWGLAHGAALMVSRAWKAAGLALPTFLAWLVTLLFVVLLFGLFRAPDLVTAGRLAEGLIGGAGLGAGWDGSVAILVGVATALALSPWTAQDFQDRWLAPRRAYAAALAALCAFVVLEVGRGQPQSFIYFQF